ncbi:hypothetical protein L1887_44454 [Cichorium endivia]|nr:hypothetical protein L1887_44454 [Cichorium endivia]
MGLGFSKTYFLKYLIQQLIANLKETDWISLDDPFDKRCGDTLNAYLRSDHNTRQTVFSIEFNSEAHAYLSLLQ